MVKPPVGIFWDFENVHPPKGFTGYEIVNRIRRFAEPFGPVSEFMAYFDANLEGRKAILQHQLQTSGTTLVHTPHNGKKEVVDKKIIVDILLFALGTPALKTIVLITGDLDFSDAISKLRLKGHKVCVVHPGPPSTRPPPSLVLIAHIIVNWQSDVLGYSECAAQASSMTKNREVSDTDPISEPENQSRITNPVSSSPGSSMGEVILYQALIHVLETMCASSNTNCVPVRQTLVHRALVKYDSGAYKRLGMSADSYFNKAVKLGIIKKSLGSTKKTKNLPFISLIPKITLKSSSRVTPQHSLDPATPPVSSTSSSTHHPVLKSCFGLLIDVLKGLNVSAGGSSIRQSTVEDRLLSRDPSFFSRMSLPVQSYILLAETAGIIALTAAGKKGARKHITLRPGYRL